MSYQVLARKWRPKTFDELAGQEHVLRALVNALENQRLHHAYLFTGTRGVGKTTIARILARSLNCETGITSSPCGVCSACQEISEGRFVDLIEVDAASRTKVEDTRDLLENVQYRPTRGRFKIYLIDEVHMLSSHSFNALLKTIEEPPEHVKFLLATTDPQKLPVTVLSRCLQFNLKNLTSARIQEHLNFVLGEEKIPSDAEALWHLARAARGSMRDALSLTDQAISHGGGKLDEASVVSMLGTVDRKKIYDLMDALMHADAKKLLSIAASLAEFSPDYFALIDELLSLVHAIALFQQIPESGRSEDFDQEKLAQYANHFSPEDVQLLYQMLLIGQKDIGITPELHMGFEMLLLRLLAFQPLKTGEMIQATPVYTPDISKEAEDLDAKQQPHRERGFSEEQCNKEPNKGELTAKKSETALVESQRIAPSPTKLSSALQETVPETVTNQIQQHKEQSLTEKPMLNSLEDVQVTQGTNGFLNAGTYNQKEGTSEQLDQGEMAHSSQSIDELYEVYQAVSGSLSEESSVDKTVDEVENVETSVDYESAQVIQTIAELTPKNWVAVFNQLPINGMVRTLCSHLVLDTIEGNCLSFLLALPGQKIFEESHKIKLTQSLSDYLQIEVNLRIQPADFTQETPAQHAERCDKEALQQAERDILDNPLVQSMMVAFDAQLTPGSVQLIDESKR